jgi:hypothetical protein
MYNGQSAGNQRELNYQVGSSETIRESRKVRYSPVKYESTYVCWH